MYLSLKIGLQTHSYKTQCTLKGVACSYVNRKDRSKLRLHSLILALPAWEEGLWNQNKVELYYRLQSLMGSLTVVGFNEGSNWHSGSQPPLHTSQKRSLMNRSHRTVVQYFDAVCYALCMSCMHESVPDTDCTTSDPPCVSRKSPTVLWAAEKVTEQETIIHTYWCTHDRMLDMRSSGHIIVYNGW